MSATVASGRVFDAFLGDDLGARTLYHGHSYGGNALAAAVALRHLELIDAWDVLANVRERSDELARAAARPHRVEAGGARGATARAHGRRRARAARRRAALRAPRVRGRDVERGVLLRPLGDVVVLMPPLTITSAEMHRIVRRARRSRSTRSTRAVTWNAWARRRRGRRSATRAGGGRRATSTRAGRRAGSPDGRVVVSFASNDYLGLTAHPAVVAAAHDALDRWGAGAGSARLIVGSRPIHARARATSSRSGSGMPRAALFPTGFAANLGVLTTFGGAGRARLLRRAEPRVDHRRLPARAGPTSRSTATATSITSTRCSRDRGDAPRARRERHRVLDGRRRRRRRRARRRSARRARRAARARRGPRGARSATSTSPPDADVLRVGTLSKTLGVARRVRRRARALRRAGREHRAAVHLHHRADAGRHRGGARRARACCSSPRATRSSRACARTSTGCARATRRRSCRSCAATKHARARRGRRAARPRPARARDPAADRRAGHLAAARHAVGRAHRRAGRAARRARSPTSSASLPYAGDRRRRRRHRHRRRQDVGDRGDSPRAPRAQRHRSRARKPAQSFAPDDTRHRRATCSPRRPGDDPDAVCPPHRWFPVPMAPPMAADALGPAAVHRSPSSSPSCRPTTPTCVFVESAGGVRSPLADDGDTVDARRRVRARARRARRRRRARARSTRCGSRVDALAAPPRGRVPQPLRPRRRPAPPQPRLAA